MMKPTIVIFFFIYLVSCKKVTNPDLAIIDNVESIDFSMFKNSTLLIRSRDYNNNAHVFIDLNDYDYKNSKGIFIVTVNANTLSCVDTSMNLIRGGYTEEEYTRMIKLSQEFMRHKFVRLSVDSLLNVQFSCYSQEENTTIKMLNIKDYKEEYTQWINYKDNWYVKPPLEKRVAFWN